MKLRCSRTAALSSKARRNPASRGRCIPRWWGCKEENLKSDKSPPPQIRIPRFPIGHEMAWRYQSSWRAHQAVQFKTSGFGFEVGFCPISNSLVPLFVVAVCIFLIYQSPAFAAGDHLVFGLQAAY